MSIVRSSTTILIALVLAALFLAACGGSGDSAFEENAQLSSQGPRGEAALLAPTAAPQFNAPTPVPPPADQSEEASSQGPGGPLLQPQEQPSAAASRVIIRTVDMTAVVDNVAAGVEAVTAVAREAGGWVVSSQQATASSGSISIRVPAARLDDVLPRLRRLAVEVEAETSSSQDVTADYVDTESRIRNLEMTRDALTRLLERAVNIDDALDVQNELTGIQEQIEIQQGRLNFLAETSAFSLVNVQLKLSFMDIQVDAGEDVAIKLGEHHRFRASFRPPAGIDRFSFSWDFGDGSSPVTGTRTIERLDGQGRLTDTISRRFTDTEQSPYIVTVAIRGEGRAGAGEGKDAMVVTVLDIPAIEVFAGEDVGVVEGEELAFAGSFTRPQGLTDFTYRWDFGDGSESEEFAAPPGETRAEATHVYANHRPQPYRVELRVTARSDAGEVEQTSQFFVRVEKGTPWVQSLHIDEVPRVAVLVLTTVGQLLVWVLAAVAVSSPLWIPAGLIALYLRKRARNTGP